MTNSYAKKSLRLRSIDIPSQCAGVGSPRCPVSISLTSSPIDFPGGRCAQVGDSLFRVKIFNQENTVMGNEDVQIRLDVFTFMLSIG